MTAFGLVFLSVISLWLFRDAYLGLRNGFTATWRDAKVERNRDSKLFWFLLLGRTGFGAYLMYAVGLEVLKTHA